MSLNKKILAAAIVSGLFATTAQAQVTLSGAGTTAPRTIASEIVASTGTPATITNTANVLNIITPLSYAFSNGEVRYVRVECSSNVRIATNSAAAYTDGGLPGATGTVSLGAVNGLGTNAISFSVTATAAGVGDTATDIFTVTGDRLITSTAAASCTYGLYDQPSQAAAGGTTGRIATTTGQYLTPQSGYTYTTTPNTSTANVEASPAFTRFVSAAPTNSTTIAQLAGITFDARTGTQLNVGGVDVSLADLFATGATGTNISVAGDFTAAQNADGTYTGGALGRVFLASDAACTTSVLSAAALSATAARFNVGATAAAGQFLCMTTLGNVAIPVADYTSTLNAVAASATYAPVSTGPLASGNIIRNGTQLQAPLAQVPTGWLSRMVLTNTGSADRPFTITVFGETGNTIGTANLTGTVPANGTIVRDLTTVLTSFTTGQAPRATLNVTVAGPNSQIQGLYQIVNPASGSISNHVMVRPGTN